MAKSARVSKSGISAGRNKGHATTVIQLPQRPSHRKGALSKKTELVREVIREAGGFTPYERRVMELIKMGTAASNKRALKYAKNKLGTHKRGKAKREEMIEAIAQLAKKRHH